MGKTVIASNSTLQPRRKLLRQGPASLSDAELLAILLGRSAAGKPAVTLAQELLQTSGSIRSLLRSSAEELTRHTGVGMASYERLQTVMEIARRQLRESLEDSDPLTSPELTRSYLQARLRDRSREIFAALFLDNRHRVRVFEELFKGTLDGAAVYPRVVAEKGLRYRAAAVIVAHNHPSGVAEPSQADVALTRRLKDALGLIDIRLLDHFIIGDGAPVSLAERGLL
jgi:DNA repair protein RadC